MTDLNPHFLNPWGDIELIRSPTPPPSIVPPVIYKPANTCRVCGLTLQQTVIGGNPVQICPAHGTRGVARD